MQHACLLPEFPIGSHEAAPFLVLLTTAGLWKDPSEGLQDRCMRDRQGGSIFWKMLQKKCPGGLWQEFILSLSSPATARLLPGSLYNPYHLPIWTRRFRRGQLICVFMCPWTFLPATGSFKVKVHGRMNPRF